jgi:hypothetical protein
MTSSPFFGGEPDLKRERVEGIEPSWPAWKAGTLPLSYTRVAGRYIAGNERFVNGISLNPRKEVDSS